MLTLGVLVGLLTSRLLQNRRELAASEPRTVRPPDARLVETYLEYGPRTSGRRTS